MKTGRNNALRFRPLAFVVGVPALFLSLEFAVAGKGDFNDDGVTDLRDYARLHICQVVSGPNTGAIDPTCAAADLDADLDVDLFDFSLFQNSFEPPALCDLRWAEGFDTEGINGTVYALSVLEDPNGKALYAAGQFAQAGDVPVARIAGWDGATWFPLDVGLNNQARATITYTDPSGPGLYVGGNFGMAGGTSANIARWDGEVWSPVATGVNSFVYSFGLFDEGNGPMLFAGGSFTRIGGIDANSIARWDGSSWTPLAEGITLNSVLPPKVSAMAVFDDGSGPALFVGGEFSAAGANPAANLAKWDGKTWSQVGSGTNNSVRDLAVFDDGRGPALYVGGNLSTAGNVHVAGIARWDGTSWEALDNGAPPAVEALIVFDDGTGPALYAGGFFIIASPTGFIEHIAKWDGKSWSALSTGMNNTVYSLAVYDDGNGNGSALYAGGAFTSAGDLPSNRIAKWFRPAAPCPGVTGQHNPPVRHLWLARQC